MAHWCRICREEEEEREAKLTAEARRLQEAEDEKRRILENREKKLQAIKDEFKIKPHHIKEDYVKQYAKKEMKNLLTNADEIRSKFLTFVSEDPELTRRLESEHPDLYTFKSFFVKAVTYAEQMWAEVDRPPRPRLTDDDVRNQLIGRIVRDVRDDKALEDMFVREGITDPAEQQRLRKKFDDLKAERAERKEKQNEPDKIV